MPHLFTIVLALLAAWPFSARAEEAGQSANLPPRCGVCHLEKVQSPGRGRFNFLDLKRADSPGETGMCYSCHNGLVRDSRRSIWAGLQHKADGTSAERAPGRKASCGTCHDPHVQTAGADTFMRFKSGASAYCLG